MLKFNKEGFFALPYRLAYWGSGFDHWNVPVNDLCPFARKAFVGFFLCLCAVIVGVVVGAALLDPIISSVLWMFGVGSGHFYGEVSLIIGFVLYAVVIISLIMMCIEMNKEKLPTIPTIPSTKEDGTLNLWGLIREYGKAVHDKVCPKITIV